MAPPAHKKYNTTSRNATCTQLRRKTALIREASLFMSLPSTTRYRAAFGLLTDCLLGDPINARLVDLNDVLPAYLDEAVTQRPSCPGDDRHFA